MMHLTEDQIYHLVEAIGNHETLTAEEEQQMEHIRSCKECMEKLLRRQENFLRQSG